MTNNIIWNDNQVHEPVTLGPEMIVRYCDISRPDRVLYPGEGNINEYPSFYNTFQERFELLMTSSCIDTGDPEEPFDPDGSAPDMGVYYEPFLIDFDAVQIFGSTPYTVQFSQEAVGFNENSIWSWDTNADSLFDVFGISPLFTYNAPGIYSVRLRVQKANIQDYIYKENYVIVQNEQLPTPQNPQISLYANDVMLSWDDISVQNRMDSITLKSKINHRALVNRTNRDQIYYLIYISDHPDGGFEFLDYTTSQVTSYTHTDILLSHDKAFYKITTFSGTLSEFRNNVSKLNKYREKNENKFD